MKNFGVNDHRGVGFLRYKSENQHAISSPLGCLAFRRTTMAKFTMIHAAAGISTVYIGVSILFSCYIINDINNFYDATLEELLEIRDLANTAWYEMRPVDPTAVKMRRLLLGEQTRARRQTFDNCNCGPQSLGCPPGLAGPPGKPGQPGDNGEPGENGRRGYDGIAISGGSGDVGCVRCPVGPPGPPGEIGPEGLPGVDGIPGVNGPDGAFGRPGPVGPIGDKGPEGVPGPDGVPGVVGKPAHYGIGLPGPIGQEGPVGAPGVPGPRGSDAVQGPPGEIGPEGLNGNPGAPGTDGVPGRRGPVGVPGKDAAYCPCPLRSSDLLMNSIREPVIPMGDYTSHRRRT
ncbi:hypothetical protein Q1695_008291 [Nippostrongylus brasiliensis]|nr:hypothetical protein Q1695_008291 [Nippostrongylus brasiliensis]